MNSIIIDYLKQLDLSEIEAKLYLTLLEVGPISVRDLAETIDIKRTTAYFYIDQLVEKELVIKLVMGSRKVVSANEPANLQHLIEKKMETANEVQKKFPTILKTINSFVPKFIDPGEAEIKYYKGKNGVKKIYEEVLKSKELRSYVNMAEILAVFPENAQLFDEAVNHNPEMKMYEIVEDSPEARERIKTSKGQPKKYLYKILPKHMKIQSTDFLIYDGKVSFINLKNKINGVVLQNTDLYNNFIVLFDYIWKTLPDDTSRL